MKYNIPSIQINIDVSGTPKPNQNEKHEENVPTIAEDPNETHDTTFNNIREPKRIQRNGKYSKKFEKRFGATYSGAKSTTSEPNIVFIRSRTVTNDGNRGRNEDDLYDNLPWQQQNNIGPMSVLQLNLNH